MPCFASTLHPTPRRRWRSLARVLPRGASMLVAAALVALAGCGAHAAVAARAAERPLPEPGEVSPRRPH